MIRIISTPISSVFTQKITSNFFDFTIRYFSVKKFIFLHRQVIIEGISFSANFFKNPTRSTVAILKVESCFEAHTGLHSN